MPAYSSVAHAGYALIGLAAYRLSDGSATLGFRVSSWTCLTYLFMNLGAFAVVILFYSQKPSHQIEDYAGLAQRAPGLALMMTIFLLSLAGLPPTAGFLGQARPLWSRRAGGSHLAGRGRRHQRRDLCLLLLEYCPLMYLLPGQEAAAVRATPGLAAALGLSLAGTLVIFLFAQPILRVLEEGTSTQAAGGAALPSPRKGQRQPVIER